MKPWFIGLALTVLAPLAVCAEEVAEPTCLMFGTVDTQVHRRAGAALERVFRSEGLCHTIEYFPGNRVTLYVEDGRLDGEVLRTPEYIASLKQPVVVVETPILETIGWFMYPKDQARPDFADPTKEFGKLSGSRWMDQFVDNPNQLIEFLDFGQAVSLVDRGRLHGVFMTRRATQLGAVNFEHMNTVELIRIPAHMYLNAQFEAEALSLDRFFRKVISDQGAVLVPQTDRQASPDQ